MAPQRLEKIEFAPEDGMGSKASNPQHLVPWRAADRAAPRDEAARMTSCPTPKLPGIRFLHPARASTNAVGRLGRVTPASWRRRDREGNFPPCNALKTHETGKQSRFLRWALRRAGGTPRGRGGAVGAARDPGSRPRSGVYECDEGERGDAARTQPLHHRHARQPLRRRGTIAADRRGHREIAASGEQGQAQAADHRRHRQSALQGEGGRARRLDRKGVGRKTCAARSVAPAARMGHGKVRAQAQEPLRLLLALGAIPGAPEPLLETMAYDAAKRRLVIGKGFVENVTPAMRAYEISGKTVLDQWFSYRRRDRTKPLIGDKRPPSPLEKIQARRVYRGPAEPPQCARSAGRARARDKPICWTGCGRASSHLRR
jgi:hypothetical protein